MTVNLQTGVINLGSAKGVALAPNDTSTFTQVTFPKPFPDGSKVLVVPMTQTFHGPNTPGLRIAEVTNTGFKIRMNELVGDSDGKTHTALADGLHDPETIGWAAFTIGYLLDNNGGDNGHQHGQGHKWHGTLMANAEQGMQTGVSLSPGDVISIAVTGKASLGSGFAMYGPDGDPAVPGTGAILPSANAGAVLMKIGQGPYKLVGSGLSGYQVQKDEGGKIAFFYNDGPTVYYDNTGSFDISLTY